MNRGLPPSNAIISEKTQACLEIAEAHSILENGRARWTTLYEAACARFSEKAVNRKMEELSERDYIDYGVSVRTGWLAERGRAVLQLCRYQAGLRNPNTAQLSSDRPEDIRQSSQIENRRPDFL